MFKHAKHSFTVSISSSSYTILVDFAERYGIKSKSSAVEFCINKASAHDKMLDHENKERIAKMIKDQAIEQADQVFKERANKQMQDLKKAEVIK